MKFCFLLLYIISFVYSKRSLSIPYELLNGNAKLFNKKNIQNIRKSMPILVIAGEDDPVGAFGKGPRELEKMYKNAGINNVSLILYPTLRHEILNEDIKKDIYKDILDFLHA